MSTHIEWIEPTLPDVVPAGSQIGEHAVEDGHVALVVGFDSIAVIEGTKQQLWVMLAHALERLEAVEHDSPIPADYTPDDNYDDEED